HLPDLHSFPTRALPILSPDAVGVSVRDPASASALAERGVRVQRGDFADPRSLAAGFAGATRVLVVSLNRLGDEATAQTAAAVEQIGRAHVCTLVTSAHR